MAKRTRPYRDYLRDSLKNIEHAKHYIRAAADESDEVFLIAVLHIAEAHGMIPGPSMTRGLCGWVSDREYDCHCGKVPCVGARPESQ